MLPRQRLWGWTIVAGALLTASPARAQSDAEKMERLERQVELLQKQLKAVQDEIKRSKKRAERQEAANAAWVTTPNPSPPAVNEVNNAYETKSSYELKELESKPLPMVPGVKVTLGGYVAAETVFRQRNRLRIWGEFQRHSLSLLAAFQ